MKTKLALQIILVASAMSSHASREVMEFWGRYDAREKPLNVEVVKQWETDTGKYQLVRYDLGELAGTNKSASPVIAAYYGLPKGESNVPGIVHIHGGGQIASKSRVESWVELGYACISINWGAKVLEEEDTPNTDWDGLAAGFIRPGISKEDGLDHHNDVDPDEHTLFKEPDLLNSSWSLIAVSARRALTFLEYQPEVDVSKLGVEGHSMGGRATVLTAIDPRVRAASPSVGGSGFLYEDLWGLPGSARHMDSGKDLDLYRKVVSAQSYWPHIKAPILFLGASNDFNSPTEWVVKGMSLLPQTTERMLALAPHLNHRFTTETDAARFMWMEAHLKGNFKFPGQSPSMLDLDTPGGVPVFSVKVDQSENHPIEKVEVYYGYARDPRIRFWRSAEVTRKGDVYSAACPVFDVNEPLFAFANITYIMDRTLPARPGQAATDLLTVTSTYQSAYPDELKASGVRATEKPQRLIDDFSRGWQDGYRLNIGNHEHWFYATRKLLDPSWMGPKDGKLAFYVVTDVPGNTMAVGIDVNRWQSYTGRKLDSYFAFVDLPVSGLNSIQLSASDFKNEKGETLKDWDEITELYFTPSNRIKSTLATSVDWKGTSPELRNLHWEGGTYIKRPYPHQPRDNYLGAAAPPTNFVQILTDDQGWGDLGSFGHQFIRTPNIDRLAQEGGKFTECYSAAGVCSPSRSAILTGRTPFRNGVFRWIPQSHYCYLPGTEVTLPQLLRVKGYQTAHFGKWHLSHYYEERIGNSEEFRNFGFSGKPGQPSMSDYGYDYWLATGNVARPNHKDPLNFFLNGKALGKVEGYSAQIVAKAFVTWMQEHRKEDKPFFITIWFHEPHGPIETNPEFMMPYQKLNDPSMRQYLGNVTQIDEAVGTIMKALEEAGISDDTLVWYTSDNGPEGPHEFGRFNLEDNVYGGSRYRGSTGGLRGRKRATHEGGIRVPGIIRWPTGMERANVKPGFVCDTPIIGSDIFPTFLEIAGIPLPENVTIDGTSILPLLEGRQFEREKPLYWRNLHYDYRIALREGDWKIVGNSERTDFELYNLKADIRETTDLSAHFPERFEQMKKALIAYDREVLAEGPKWWNREQQWGIVPLD